NNSSYLGICVGMQILSDWGYEDKTTRGLGIISGDIKKFRNKKLIIPHMGWNELKVAASHPVLDGVQTGDHVYFVHSYHFEVAESAALLASVDYGGDQTAIVGRDNMIGTQFHPEKSQATGLRIIENFLNWRP
ncbi:MAG: imidazole glycerol phosphate synthase subunit HisH, partial [Pseudomonadota bacterium]|nr:imidazole glycerol phosphate synthase subunit HisH [Pseudomonadota bacterium]